MTSEQERKAIETGIMRAASMNDITRVYEETFYEARINHGATVAEARRAGERARRDARQDWPIA